jgi:hypothetical protein
MRPKFLLWVVGSILALGIVMRVGNAVMSYIPVVDARVMETAPTPAPILKPPAQAPSSGTTVAAPDNPKQPSLDLSVQGYEHGVLRITNRNKETYHGLLLRLIVGADFNSWTAVLRDVAPGDSITVHLRDITNDRGERFDPALWRRVPKGRFAPAGPHAVIEGTLADGTKATAHW